jgi:hypothetical protein
VTVKIAVVSNSAAFIGKARSSARISGNVNH